MSNVCVLQCMWGGEEEKNVTRQKSETKCKNDMLSELEKNEKKKIEACWEHTSQIKSVRIFFFFVAYMIWCMLSFSFSYVYQILYA